MEEIGKIKTEFKTYEEFEQQVSTELSKQAESFVRLGYLMKIARDTDILQSSGYANVTEFAADKYNLTKDQVSRFIHINDKFSKKGYSEELEDQYKGYGYSKLSVMLTLPESVVNVLDPQMTRSQIVEVQKEYKEEKAISPLEAMMEKKDPMQQELTSNLEKFLHQYGYNNREMFKRLADARVKGGDFAENIMDVIAPTGVAQLTERIMGVGKLLLSIKGKDEMIQVVNMREDSTEKFQWSDLCNALSLYGDGSKETWEELYGEPYEVAEELLEKEKGNDEERDDSRDNKAGEGKDAIHTKDDTKTEKKSEQTEQDAGQISGRGVEELPVIKVKAITEELKDKLFDIWFSNVSEDKIDSACKMMNNMKFIELINATPKKMFLLVQTSEVTTNEVVKDGIPLTEVTTENYAGTFTPQEFQKRFNRKYLEPYKERMKELEEKKEAQLEKEETDEGIALLSECVYEIIKKYREKLIGLTEFTEETVKNALDATTEQVPWLEFDVDSIRCEARVDLLGISKMKDLVVYKGNDTEEYVWTMDEVYKEIADVLNFDEEALHLQEEQIPGQMKVDDYPELKPDDVIQEIQEENAYTSIAFRCIPKDIVFFIAGNKVEEAKVEEVTVKEDLIPMITVKATDPNALIVVEFNQKEDWGTKIFKTRAAAERKLQQQADEKQC